MNRSNCIDNIKGILMLSVVFSHILLMNKNLLVWGGN